mgnify:CR=1 FL=1|tara:strand:- start:5511 stop:7604 length:2094 start_codon:yes stop_codon:yes gene_type:complete
MAISAAQQAILDAEREANSKDQVISADQQAMIDALPKPSISEPGSGAYTEKMPGAMFAQGLTFGFADEIQAFAQSLIDSDTDYKTARNEIRAKLNDYRDAYGGEALAMEMSGAVLPSVLAIFGGPGAWSAAVSNLTRMTKSGMTFLKGFAKSPKQTLTQPTGKNLADAGVTSQSILNVTGRSAASGGVYGLGASEQETMTGMGTDIIQTAMASAVLAPIMALGGKGIAKLVTRQGGKNKIDKPVRDELTKLVNQTGLTEDEVVMAVMRGELMTENKSLLFAIKQLVRGNPKARNQLADEIELRPLETRKDLITAMQSSIGRGTADDNLITAYKKTDKKFKDQERAAYDKVLVTNNKELDSEMTDALFQAIKQFDGGLATINKLQKTEKIGKKDVFFEIIDDEIVLKRQPTTHDAEIIYRAIRNEKDRLFRAGETELSTAYKSVMSDLKEALDKFSPSLAQVRTDAYNLRQAREAYKYGKTAWNKSPDEIEDYLLNLQDEADVPNIMQSLRDGMLTTIKGKDAPSIARKLADGNTNLQEVVRMVFPDEAFEDIVTKASTASKAQIAAGKMPEGSGSPSFPLLAEALKMGNAQSGRDAVMTITAPLVKAITESGIDEKTASGIVDIVTSRNPELVRKALIDDNAMNMLQKLINDVITQGSKVSGNVVGNVSGNQTTQKRNYLNGLLDFASQMTQNVVAP